jgi:hypothetical protein
MKIQHYGYLAIICFFIAIFVVYPFVCYPVLIANSKSELINQELNGIVTERYLGGHNIPVMKYRKPNGSIQKETLSLYGDDFAGQVKVGDSIYSKAGDSLIYIIRDNVKTSYQKITNDDNSY